MEQFQKVCSVSTALNIYSMPFWKQYCTVNFAMDFLWIYLPTLHYVPVSTVAAKVENLLLIKPMSVKDGQNNNSLKVN